ncbi:MAG: hypothetical protein U0892_13520 [Pirellulales bacterium]
MATAAGNSVKQQSDNKSRNSGRSDDSRMEKEDGEDFAQLVSEVSDSIHRYYSARPGVCAATIFGLGFFFGWKLRPW